MPAEKMKILIVDDHKGMRELMRSYLPAAFDEIYLHRRVRLVA